MNITYNDIDNDEKLFKELEGLCKYARDHGMKESIELIARAFNLGIQWNYINDNTNRPIWPGRFDFEQILELAHIQTDHRPINVESFSDLIADFDPNAQFVQNQLNKVLTQVKKGINDLTLISQEIEGVKNDGYNN